MHNSYDTHNGKPQVSGVKHRSRSQSFKEAAKIKNKPMYPDCHFVTGEKSGVYFLFIYLFFCFLLLHMCHKANSED